VNRGKGIFRLRHRRPPIIRKVFVVMAPPAVATVQVPIWPHIVRMATLRIKRM
jgi:hypothetical protein